MSWIPVEREERGEGRPLPCQLGLGVLSEAAGGPWSSKHQVVEHSAALQMGLVAAS